MDQATNLAMLDIDISQGSTSLPNTQLVCNAQPCFKYFWQTGTWGECSKSCNGGVKVRAVRCAEYTTAVVSDSFCEQSANLPAKPASTMSCNEQSCTMYGWRQGSWCTTQLPATGTAQLPVTSLVTLKRNITCVDQAGAATSDIFCKNHTDVIVPQMLFSCSSACAISSYYSDDRPVATRRAQSTCTIPKSDATAIVDCLVTSFEQQLAQTNSVRDRCAPACRLLFEATYEPCVSPYVSILVDPDIAVPLAAARSICTAATTDAYCMSPDAVRCIQECTPCATGSDRTTSGLACSSTCNRCILYLPCTVSGWANQSVTQGASGLTGTWYGGQKSADGGTICRRLRFVDTDLHWSTQVFVAGGSGDASACTNDAASGTPRVTASERFGVLSVWQGRGCEQGCIVDLHLYRKDGSKSVFDVLLPGMLWLSANSSTAAVCSAAEALTLANAADPAVAVQQLTRTNQPCVTCLLACASGDATATAACAAGCLVGTGTPSAAPPTQTRRLTLLTLKEDCVRNVGCASQTPRPTADDRTRYSELYEVFEFRQDSPIGASEVTSALASAQNFQALLPNANALATCTTPKGDCVFPFLYNGVEYNSCASTGDSRPAWCFVGTRIGPDWSACGADCTLPAVADVTVNFTAGKPEAFGTAQFPAGGLVAEPSSWLMISTGDVSGAFSGDTAPVSFDFPPAGASGDVMTAEIRFSASAQAGTLGLDYVFMTVCMHARARARAHARTCGHAQAEPAASGMLSPELTDSFSIEVNGQLRRCVRPCVRACARA
jgi:hypothetical protein